MSFVERQATQRKLVSRKTPAGIFYRNYPTNPLFCQQISLDFSCFLASISCVLV